MKLGDITEHDFYNYRPMCMFIDMNIVPHFCEHHESGNATCDTIENCPLTKEQFNYLVGLNGD